MGRVWCGPVGWGGVWLGAVRPGEVGRGVVRVDGRALSIYVCSVSGFFCVYGELRGRLYLVGLLQPLSTVGAVVDCT